MAASRKKSPLCHHVSPARFHAAELLAQFFMSRSLTNLAGKGASPQPGAAPIARNEVSAKLPAAASDHAPMRPVGTSATIAVAELPPPRAVITPSRHCTEIAGADVRESTLERLKTLPTP